LEVEELKKILSSEHEAMVNKFLFFLLIPATLAAGPEANL
jgi:hypothetical protein